MPTLNEMVNRLRGLDVERMLGLRPPYPPVAVEMDRSGAVLVRLKPRRREKPLLEAHQSRPVPEASMPPSIFQNATAPPEELSRRLAELFETSGTKPGKVSVILPDNLAKITLLDLPERPSSARHLDELVRSKMRRAVPFRLEEARLAYQVFSGEKRGITVLVVLTRTALVERIEQAFERIGARPGLIEICTPNLVNLCRSSLQKACKSGSDAALLNCARDYFSLAILRGQRLIFFRCKTFSFNPENETAPNGILVREVANSFSYYAEKLGGKGIGTVMVRSISTPVDEIAAKLRELEIDEVRRIDPAAWVDANGSRMDDDAGQLLAPAIGAAVGRGALMQTLDLNLAGRPFRNNTLLWVGYGLGLVALATFSVWSVARYLEMRGEASRIVDTEVNFDTRMTQLKQRNDRVLAGVKAVDLGSLWAQSGKANEVIAWKSFSWTRLFNVLEEVQPYDVRMTSVRPMFRTAADDETAADVARWVPVAVEGIAKTYGAVTDFQRALQDAPQFTRIEPLSSRTTDKREIKYTLRFRYAPQVDEPADAAELVAESGEDGAAPANGDETAAPVETAALEEVGDEGFGAAQAEEDRSEPAATDDIKRRIRRPRAAGEENGP